MNPAKLVQQSVRRIRRNPGTSLVIVLTLALCIGAASALFSVIKAALLEPFPYAHHQRLVMAVAEFPAAERESWEWSMADALELLEQDEVFEHVIVGYRQNVNLTGGDRPERVAAVRVSGNVFSVHEVPPALGQTFTTEEAQPGGPNVVVISHGLWQRRFGSDPDLVGSEISIEGEKHTVLGVMPPRFAWWGSEMWFPLRAALDPTQRTPRFLTLVGRLQPSVTLEQAEAALEPLAARIESEFGGSQPEYKGWRVSLRPYLDQVVGNVRPALLVLLGVVALILVMACGNIANLLMAQVASREREIAVRSALGAGRRTVLAQLLTESLILALVGGALGALATHAGVGLLLSIIPEQYISKATIVDVDLGVLAATTGLSMLSGIAFGLAPGIQALRLDIAEGLKEGGGQMVLGRRGGFFRKGLVVLEVALALVVVVGAGLMVQSFRELLEIDPGFDADNAVTAQVSLPSSKYPDLGSRSTFFRQLIERLDGRGEIESVGGLLDLPLAPGSPVQAVGIEGAAEGEAGPRQVRFDMVLGDAFEAMGVPVLRGRAIDSRDTENSQPVAMINQAFAEKYFSDNDPVGRRIKLGGRESGLPWRTVVGVVGDIKKEDLHRAADPAFYLPYHQAPNRPVWMFLMVRSRLPGDQVVNLVRDEVLTLDPDQPLDHVQTLRDLVMNPLGGQRLAMVLLTLFAGLAILLSALGIFGMMAYSVSQRTREIGVRMALGAPPSRVRKLVLRDGMALAGAGVALGLLGAFFLSRALQSLVYGISTTDLATYAGAAFFFLAVSLAAVYVPARRATRVDPLEALHHE